MITEEPTVTAAPNPANSLVSFHIRIPVDRPFATLRVLDVNGKIVHHRKVTAGEQNVRWLPRNDVSAGIYYYYLETVDRRTLPKKLVLLR